MIYKHAIDSMRLLLMAVINIMQQNGTVVSRLLHSVPQAPCGAGDEAGAGCGRP